VVVVLGVMGVVIVAVVIGTIVGYKTAPPEWSCPRCGYDRRGLAADAKCPECGMVPIK
jgi:rubrerythrin